MGANGKTLRRLSMIAWAISTMMLASCVTMIGGVPKHCVTKDEWRGYAQVAQQKQEIFKPDATGAATRYVQLAGRISELEKTCKGINAFRGE